MGIGVWSIPRTETPATRTEPQTEAARATTEADVGDETQLAMLEDAPADDAARTKAAPSPAPKAAERSAARAAARPERSAAVGGSAEAGHVSAPMASEAALVAEELDAARGASANEEEALPSTCTEKRGALQKKGREATGHEALALGRCYRDAGQFEQARVWFERAAEDPQTRARAKRALKSLPQP